MRLLIIVLVLIVSVAPSFATVDPDPDQVGIYFDSNADVTCIDVPPSVPFWAYVVITNPSSAEVHGVEFSLCVEYVGGIEGMLFRLTEEWWFDPIIYPVEFNWCSDGIVFGGTPLLPQGVNAVVVRLQYLLLAPMGLNFYLGAHPSQSIEDGLPAYLGTGGVVLPLGVSSGDPSLPVASVNGCNAVTVEGTTFGGMKCLFR